MADETTGKIDHADASSTELSSGREAGAAPTGAPASAIPEPQILEEHIVKRSAPKKPAQTPITPETTAPATPPVILTSPVETKPTPTATVKPSVESATTGIDTTIIAPVLVPPVAESATPTRAASPASPIPVSDVPLTPPTQISQPVEGAQRTSEINQPIYGTITPPPGFRSAVGAPAQETPRPTPTPSPEAVTPPAITVMPTMAPATPAPEPATHTAQATDMARVLQEVKLPDRREYTATGEQKKPNAKVIEIPTGLGESRQKSPAEEPASAIPATPQEPEALAPFHTLKNDLQSVVKDQKLSLVRAAALEQEKRGPVQEDVPQPERRRSRSYGIVFTILLLIFLGAAALGGVYFVAQQQSGIPESTPSTSIVFAEQTVAFPVGTLAATAIRAQLAQARTSSNAALGSIVRVVPAKGDSIDGGTPMTFSEFLQSIDAQAPENLVRALGDNFFFGLHTVDENAPLIVVSVVSYDRAFAGMLEWENTMNASLAPIFTPVSRLITGPDGIPTERPFSDFVMRNYDTRVLKDDTGTIQLYYAFPTRELLVIAESPYSFTEILSRLQAERRL